jgi:two-component system response regulator FixJ
MQRSASGLTQIIADPADPAHGSKMNRRAPPPTKVFIVDDDDAVRDSIKVLLEVHGIEVEDYGSTAEFASRYRKPQCGCLIIDQHLPVLTGVDFLNSPAGKGLDIPVILITGRSDPALEERAREAGVAEYLQKPLGERVLLATVARLTAER